MADPVNLRNELALPSASSLEFEQAPVPRFSRATRQALWAALFAVLTIALLHLLVPFGVDTAGHAYQTWRWQHSGFQFWDNYWYDGRYVFVNYSLLYYPLAGVLGRLPIVIASLAGAGFLFARLLGRRFGVDSHWASPVFAIAASAVVWLSGEYPFALGLALALATVSLAARSATTAALAGLATFLASPLAFLLMLVGLLGILLGAGRAALRPALLLGLALCLGLAAAVQLSFPLGGHLPYGGPWVLLRGMAIPALALALSWRLGGVAVLRGVFVAIAFVACAAFFIRSPLGGNATRLLDYLAAPLICVLLARRMRERRFPRTIALGLAVLSIAAQLGPTALSASRALGGASASPEFWAGAIAFLKSHADPRFRTEAVDSANHWDTYFLPVAGIPIVRGWFRQSDFPGNGALYRAGLSPSSYRHWLRQNGVRFVVLPRAPLDYSAAREARLLQSGGSGLKAVYADRFTEVFRLPRASPILVPPSGRSAALLRFASAEIEMRLSGPGSYRLAVHDTPFWRVEPAGAACLRPRDGMTSVVAPHGGTVRLHFEASLDALVEGAAPQSSCWPSTQP